MQSGSADWVRLVRRHAWVLGVILFVGLPNLPTAPAAAVVVAREISREQALQLLQKRYGNAARVVRTDVTEQAGRRVYVFRLLSVNGRVWVVRIDAQNGAEVP
jgi:hypothetical protein